MTDQASDVTVSDEQRRRRLVDRHALHGRATSVEDAVAAVVALHSSDPATPYLSCWARVDGFAHADLATALHDTRTLWRLHAMRRTLFVTGHGDAAVLQAAAGDAVATRERTRTLGWIADAVEGDAEAWTAARSDEVLAILAEGDELSTKELGERVPELRTTLRVGSGKWAAEQPALPRVLFLLAMEGRIVRTRPTGSWRSSQYAWSEAATWFETLPEAPADEPAAQAALVRRYLGRFGPATRTDLRWWTGWTAGATDAAIAAVDAITVTLEDGAEAYVLPDDLDDLRDEPAVGDEPTVALLPGLDPTPMGWKERAWFLGPHEPHLFDRNGNVGPTIWVDGRIVGGWSQHADGDVVVELLEEVAPEAAATIDGRAGELTAWLDGTVVTPRFRTPLEKALRDG